MHLMRFFQAPGMVGMRKLKQENKENQKKNLTGAQKRVRRVFEARCWCCG